MSLLEKVIKLKFTVIALRRENDSIDDIYKNYSKFTNNENKGIQHPWDSFALRNCEGNIVYIGGETGVKLFINNEINSRYS